MRWVIGDIHGMLQPLQALLSAIERADADAKLLFVGDYVNRGPDSSGVIDLLLQLRSARFVRGNHDDVFDLVLSGQSFTGEHTGAQRAEGFQWFMQHGLDATFRSYGATGAELSRTLRAPTPENLDALCSFVPEAHKRFIHSLEPVIEDEELFVAHARWDIHTPSESPGIGERLSTPALRYQLIWGRYGFEEVMAPKRWKRTGYFGHTPTANYIDGDDGLLPLIGPKIVLLDTGLALSTTGRLTAMCHESREVLQVDHSGSARVST